MSVLGHLIYRFPQLIHRHPQNSSTFQWPTPCMPPCGRWVWAFANGLWACAESLPNLASLGESTHFRELPGPNKVETLSPCSDCRTERRHAILRSHSPQGNKNHGVGMSIEKVQESFWVASGLIDECISLSKPVSKNWKRWLLFQMWRH